MLYIFDVGGVVSLNTDISPRIAERLGLAGTKIHELARGEFDQLVRGQITVQQFWARVSALTGRTIEEDLWTTFFRPVPNAPVVALVNELRRGHRVVAGTNTITPHYRIHEEGGDYAIFDAVYASHRMHLAKPDPDFYLHILEREGCRPRQAVFVDDMEANVEAARSVGIHAFLFTDAGELRRQLDTLRDDAGA
jgi:putative hydrolase of the HAD superfamily